MKIVRSSPFKNAKLKLALLKENFKYLEFYEKLESDPYNVCPELRKPDEDNEEYQARVHIMGIQGDSLFAGYAKEFGVNEKFFIEAQKNGFVPTNEILFLFDPKKSEDISCPPLLQILPRLFYLPGLYEFGQTTGLPSILDYNDLQPYERLLRLDLRKRKSELLKEVKDFIEQELKVHKAGLKLNLRSALTWEPKSDRQRREAWQQLEVWKLRKQKKSFLWISKELGITEDLAKKCFYRAYELTQKEFYDPDQYRKEAWKVRKSDLLRICNNCEDKKCLGQSKTGGEWDPCPHILRHIDQDQVSLKEKYLKEDSNSYKDTLKYRSKIEIF